MERPGLVVAAAAAGVVLVAEGVVHATGRQTLTDVLLLAGIALAVAAFLGLARLRPAAGGVARAAVVGVVLGGAAQVVAIAVGLASERELGLVHGIGFLVMSLGLLGYGLAAWRRLLLPRPLALVVAGMAVLPLTLGLLVSAVLPVEGATTVWGALWLGAAALVLVATPRRERAPASGRRSAGRPGESPGAAGRGVHRERFLAARLAESTLAGDGRASTVIAVEQEHLARKAELAELLLDVARKLGETLEPERVYERFHELLDAVVPHDGIVVSSYSPEDDLIRCDYAWTDGAVLDASTLPPVRLDRRGGGMQSRVIVSGEALLFNDVSERVERREGTFYNVDREGRVEKVPESGAAGVTAAMMVPVKHEGRVVGVVQVMSDRGSYSDAQLEVVEALVGQMAAAVRNARLQKERQRLAAAEAAARATAAEREQAAQVLEGVGEGIFLVANDGTIGLWNREAERVTGVPGAAARGRPPAESFPGWEALAGRVPVAAAGETPRSVTLPLGFEGRDLWLSFVAVESADGVVYAFRDVTAERRLEEEKSDFVATISHELRTPLAAVYGAAETLLHRELDPTSGSGRELLETIRAQTERLGRIVDEVLLTHELDRGELRVARETVDVAELVRTTVDAMRSSLPPVRVDEAQPVAPVAGDPDRIRQVLVNLLDNAAKYGGGSAIRVSLEQGTSDVVIAVADRGPGIAPGEEERVFEKFYRADPQLMSTAGGTGLGLYIARELAHRMGGRLGVTCPADGGATFVLELPRA